MISREKVAFTPDGTVRWMRAETSHGTCYAPEEMLAESGLRLSIRRARDFGTRIGGGGFGDAFRNGDLVMKESLPSGWDVVFWERCAGLTAVRMNVAMQVGLERVGDRAVLPGGARLLAPRILGMYVVHDEVAVRTLMTFEEGRHPGMPDDLAVIGTRQDRQRMYDAAYRSVGGDAGSLDGYDDTPGNLMMRHNSGGAEVVKLDTCNYREPADSWDALEAA